MRKGFEALAVKIVSLGEAAGDSLDLRRDKRLAVASTVFILLAGFIWSSIYYFFNEPLAAAVPLSYSLLSLANLALFSRTHNFSLFRFVQLLAILWLPFLLQVVLGGFINSSAVILWSLLCPFGALVFCGPRIALRWFLAFLGLVLLGGILEGQVSRANNLPPSLINAFFVLNIAAISATAFVLLSVFIRQLNSTLDQLVIERAKSENLLLNILPKEIAPILKDNPGTIAEHYDCATILFADIVNFTSWSVELTPAETVRLLNEIFSHFDSLLEKYGIEKIRTIGDNYMCVAGVPTPRPDHAQAMARMALDMRSFIRALPPRNGKRLDFRIGINSGPLVAGVIGKKKFVYDLWGDPVNVAARMESHGVPGKIQLTSSTYALIKEVFICEPRGLLEIKGKGAMATWFLVREAKRPAALSALREDARTG